jgi:hypothetical protein
MQLHIVCLSKNNLIEALLDYYRIRILFVTLHILGFIRFEHGFKYTGY